MPTNKRVFTLRLSDEVFDKIGALAAREHRLKHLEDIEKEGADHIEEEKPE